MPREWDATTYDALPLPHTQWGQRTIAKLQLNGAETVLDAGCGTGRDAQLLLDRLPDGHVIGADGSRQMLAQFDQRLAASRGMVTTIHTNLIGEPPLSDLIHDPVDAVMSVAAFHWIADHDLLFARLAAVMRPGAQFVADCGGAGNIAQVRKAIDEVLGPHPAPWTFRTAEDARKSLEQAGFEPSDVQLRVDPARFVNGTQLRDYLRTVVLGGHLDAIPADRHNEFVDAVARRLPEPVVDYVRLEFTARKSPT